MLTLAYFNVSSTETNHPLSSQPPSPAGEGGVMKNQGF